VPAHFDDCDPPPIRWQDVQEVWFSGDHSDVGGGREPDQSALANVSLHWMVNEAHDAGLRVCLDEYSKIVPNTEELLPSHVHDEMRRSLGWKLFWGFVEYCPRRDLNNEPPPPKLSMLRIKSLGPRPLEPSARQGVVTIHRSAQRCYPGGSLPWTGARTRFVDTTERVLSSVQTANATLVSKRPPGA